MAHATSCAARGLRAMCERTTTMDAVGGAASTKQMTRARRDGGSAPPRNKA